MEEMDKMETQRISFWDLKLLDKEIENHGETLKAVVSDLLSSNTDEDMLQHLYEELLDASMYIKTLILQRKTF